MFDRNMLNNHSLILYIGRDEVSYAILQEAQNQIVYLKSYRLPDSHNTYAFKQALHTFFAQEDIIRNNFVSVHIGINAAHQTLVPKAYFDEQELEKYFDFNFQYKPQKHQVFYEKLVISDVVNVFAVDKEVLKLIEEGVGKNYQLKHAATFLIDQIIGVNKGSHKKMFVNVQKHHLDITTIQGNQLLYHNTYYYETSNDFLYYTANAAKHTGVNLSNDKVVMLGDINEDHIKFQLCKKYIANVHLGSRPITKNYCTELAVLPDNYHYNLFSIL